MLNKNTLVHILNHPGGKSKVEFYDACKQAASMIESLDRENKRQRSLIERAVYRLSRKLPEVRQGDFRELMTELRSATEQEVD